MRKHAPRCWLAEPRNFRIPSGADGNGPTLLTGNLRPDYRRFTPFSPSPWMSPNNTFGLGRFLSP